MKPPPPARPTLFDPDGPGDDCRPEVAHFLVDGFPFKLHHWTAAEWARLPRDRRPADACHGSRGSWYWFTHDAGPDA